MYVPDIYQVYTYRSMRRTRENETRKNDHTERPAHHEITHTMTPDRFFAKKKKNEREKKKATKKNRKKKNESENIQ